MIVGVTGSRYARPDHVVRRLLDLLTEWGATELHHGDCVGWDAQAHDVAVLMGIRTVAHPPTDERRRAWCRADTILPPRPYLERNRDIVDCVHLLVAAPEGPATLRSGTWSTVRYAEKIKRRGLVIGVGDAEQRIGGGRR